MQNRGKFTLYIKLPCILCSYSSSWTVGHLLELGFPYYLVTSTPLCVKKKKRCYRLFRSFPLFSLEWHFAVGLHIRSVSGNLSNYTLNYSSIQYFWCILQKHLYFYIRFPFSVFHSFYIFLYKFFPLFISFVLSILDPWWWFHIKYSYCLKRFF